ncbi:hypothetical protein RhiirC2_798112, partial [Rhizophagus irregularis]
EPEDQLCILKCQHTLSLNNLKKLKQKICSECREKIEEDDIRYLSQNSIYKYLYNKFSESGHILPPIELENSDQIYDSDDSDNSEADLILIKKKNFMNPTIKLNSNISLSSILSRNSKKQHPTYQNIINEINEKHYKKAESLCKEFLNFFPKSYSLRCILAYIYRCLKNYKQAHFYLKEAINLKPKEPIAYLIYLDKVIQLDPLNSLAYYFKSLTYYTKKDINNAIIVFKKYKELLELFDFNDIITETQLHLECLLNKNNSTELNNLLAKIKKFSNIKGSKLLLLIRCKIHMELNMHHEIKIDLELLFSLSQSYFEVVSHYYFLRECIVDFWPLLKVFDEDLFRLGIVNEFSKHMYKELCVYFISNLVNLNSQLHHFQENDINNINSLSGKVINPKNEKLYLNLPILEKFNSTFKIIWKINVKEILHKECFIKFIIKNDSDEQQEHILKHEDVLKLVGLGWIEYQLPII